MRPSASPSSKCCLGWKSNFAWRADLAQLLVRALVADRNVVGRHIWNGGEVILERLVVLALLRLAVADRDFELRRPPPSAPWRAPRPSPPWPGRCRSRLRCGGLAPPAISEIVARRCSSRLQNLIQGFAGLRGAAIGQPFDEGVLVLANPFDVEQGLGPTGGNRGFPIRLATCLVIVRERSGTAERPDSPGLGVSANRPTSAY